MRYLYRKDNPKASSHLWDQARGDTACRMWSTGGMSKKGCVIESEDPLRPICTMCLAKAGAFGKGINPRPAEKAALAGGAISVWTDGSCWPNPGGPGGWAWHDGNGNHRQGGENRSTNNRMELAAILNAMTSFPAGAHLLIHSDSQYAINGLTVWAAGWKRKNWIRDGEPIPNRDLWVLLDRQKSRINAHFKWVRGHDGEPNNERADELAEQARVVLTEYGSCQECGAITGDIRHGEQVSLLVKPGNLLEVICSSCESGGAFH